MELPTKKDFVHIPLILLAEFDIHRGSQITQTYPTGILEEYGHRVDGSIVDLMLPEGAQQQVWDFSVFMINRKATAKIMPCVDDEVWVKVGDKMQKQSLNPSKPLPPERERKSSTSSFLLSPKKNKSAKDFLFCYNIIHTKNEKANVTNRGATIKALTIGCTHQFFHVYKPLIWTSLLKYFEKDRPGPELLEIIYSQLNAIDISKTLLVREQYLNYWTKNKLDCFATSSHNFFDKLVNISIPLHYLGDEVAEASLHLLLSKFQEKTMIIYDGIILEKKIMFLGHDVPIWLICRYVFSACLLAQPLTAGTLHERAYPYANLGYFDFLNSEGYIVGVSNPYMKDKKKFDYWDILCDINTGEVFSETQPSTNSSLLSKASWYWSGGGSNVNSNSDTVFIQKVLTGLKVKNISEIWLRQQFYTYTFEMLHALLKEEMGAKDIGENINKERMLKLKEKNSYKKWNKENIHHFATKFQQNFRISKKMWDLNLILKKMKEQMEELESSEDYQYPETAKVQLESYLIVTVRKLINAAVTDDEVMEVFSLIIQNKINITELINNSHTFPEEIKKEFFELVNRQLYLVKILQQ